MTAHGGFKIGDAPDLDQSGAAPGKAVVVAGDGVTFELATPASTPDAGDVAVTPAGGIAATDVQAALEELDTEKQPADSDLTAIAALSTTAFGRGLLILANQAALLSAAGAAAASHGHAGEDITSGTVADARIASTIARDSEVTSAISALSSVYQPLDSDLTAIAALTTTAYGRSLLEAANAAALRTLAGLVIGTDVPAQSVFDDHSGRHEDGGADEISIQGLSGTPAALQSHLDDTADAHDASAISVDSTNLDGVGTDLQTVLEELDAATGGGGPPTGSAGGALDGSYPNPGLAASVAGAGLAETADVLSVNVDGSTIEINVDTLRVKAGGIGANEIAANAVGSSELADDAVDTNAIQNNAVTAAKVAADVATQAELDAHVGDSSAAHAASAISADSTTLVGTGTDVQAVLEELDNGIADHLADASDAHDASAISVADSGNNYAATDVEGVLAEIAPQLGGGSTNPDDADLVYHMEALA